MKKARFCAHATESPVKFLVKHAELYLLHQIDSPHKCHPAFPAFVDQLVKILIRFAPDGADTAVLRQQYTCDVVRAFVA
jgi:hypothetical protein